MKKNIIFLLVLLSTAISAQEIFEYEGIKIPYDDIPILVWDHLDSEQMRKEFQREHENDPHSMAPGDSKSVEVKEDLAECDTVLFVNNRYYGMIRIQSETAEQITLSFSRAWVDKSLHFIKKITTFALNGRIQEITIPPSQIETGSARRLTIPGDEALLVYEIIDVGRYVAYLNTFSHKPWPLKKKIKTN